MAAPEQRTNDSRGANGAQAGRCAVVSAAATSSEDALVELRDVFKIYAEDGIETVALRGAWFAVLAGAVAMTVLAGFPAMASTAVVSTCLFGAMLSGRRMVAVLGACVCGLGLSGIVLVPAAAWERGWVGSPSVVRFQGATLLFYEGGPRAGVGMARINGETATRAGLPLT